jgi:hypothetical protein
MSSILFLLFKLTLATTKPVNIISQSSLFGLITKAITMLNINF